MLNGMSGQQVQQQNISTNAFYAQAIASFVVSGVAVAVGVALLDGSAWVRGFLGLGMLYLVTSAFSLSKVIRDRQEANQVVSRVDQARLDKLLAEHDPFRTEEAPTPPLGNG